MNDINKIAAAVSGGASRHSIIVIVEGSTHTFANLKEFRANKHLWHDKPHVAFSIRSCIGANYKTN